MKSFSFLLVVLLVSASFSIKEGPVSLSVTDNNLKAIVKHLEKNFTGKMRKSPHIAKAHFKETILDKDTYTGYFESLGYAIYMGEKNGNVANYAKYKFYCENTRAKIKSYPSTTPSLRESLRVRYYGPFSTNKFTYKLVEDKEHQDYFTIKCNNKKIANSNFSEVFVKVDRESFNVLEVSYETKTFYSMIYKNRLKADVKINYVYLNSEPFVASIETIYNKNGLTHQTSFKLLDQKLDSFELTKDEFWAFNAYDRFPYISYEVSQWNIDSPTDFDKIQQDLAGITVPVGEYFIESNTQIDGYPVIENQKGHLELAQSKMSQLKDSFDW